jgi:HEAT repeat protein
MLPRLSCLLLLAAGLFLAPSGRAGAADPDALTDEQLLRSAGVATDDAGLLSFFRKRSQVEVDPDQVAALVQKLGSKSSEERDRAAGELVALGPLAVPALRQATRDPDEPGTATAAQKCLKFIEADNRAVLPAAAARLLVQKKAQGAAEALLDYLPFADDETVLDEIKAALSSLVSPGEKIDPAFLRSLQDKSSLRRAFVAELLVRSGSEEVFPAVRKLLQDPRPVVRFRVARVLAEARDPEAVGTLIASLADLPPVLARQAEEYLVNLAADQSPKVSLGTDDTSRRRARDAWAEWWRRTEGGAPLEVFRKRTLTDADRVKIQALIRQLGDDGFDARERAQAALAEYGSGVAPLLRQALQQDDEEVKKRAQKVLEAVEKDRASTLLPVYARLIALRKPPGAAEVLLHFLPFADEETVLEEVRAALAAVAVRNGKPEPVVVQALEDKLPLRRGIAAEALTLGGAVETRPAVSKLLNDADLDVRLRVALALATARAKEAVPVLIDLLGELPTQKGTQAELFLRGVAGDAAPNLYLGADDESRKKVKEAWQSWWKANAATVVLGRPSTAVRLLGYTLIVSTDWNRLLEVGLDGKIRWQLDGLQYPRDAQVLPGDRILVAEQGIQRVAEWNLKREVLWQKQLNGPPVSVQRQPNGNTFIAMSNGLIEVDRSGKEVFTYQRPNYDIMSGHKGPDGQMAIVTNNGMVVRFDSRGKETKSFSIGGQAPWSVEVLSNGNVLVPHPGYNRVVEYNADGKIVWEAAVQNPFSATRLPNGNTVVGSYNQRKVVELNRGGRVVWEYTTTNQDRPYRVRRR